MENQLFSPVLYIYEDINSCGEKFLTVTDTFGHVPSNSRVGVYNLKQFGITKQILKTDNKELIEY